MPKPNIECPECKSGMQLIASTPIYTDRFRYNQIGWMLHFWCPEDGVYVCKSLNSTQINIPKKH